MRLLFLLFLLPVLASASCNAQDACTLCFKDLLCTYLYDGSCADVEGALHYFNTTTAAGDPRRLYYPTSWLASLPATTEACEAVASSSFSTLSIQSLALLDALVRYKVILTTAGVGCTDPNERIIYDPDSSVFACQCAIGYTCLADAGGDNASDTAYILLIINTAIFWVLIIVSGTVLVTAVLKRVK
jgi:hypothetical protein